MRFIAACRPLSYLPLMPTPLTLVLMAAGMGSRYGGLKQVEPMGPAGESLVDYAVFDAKRAGFEKFEFIIREDIERDFRETVGKRLSEGGVMAGTLWQDLDDLPDGLGQSMDLAHRSKPWGTAHAVWAARNYVETPFAVLNADDYYGPGAYQLLADHLRRETGEYAIVGYNLGRTLSDHGAVARGLLEKDSESRLVRIAERTQIERLPDGRVVDHGADGRDTELSPDADVSMNIMGFTPSIFPQLEAALRAFVREHGQETKSELYLPNVVGQLVTTDKADVRVLSADDDWFGVTYAADTAVVRDRLRELHAAGVYPKALWPSG